MLKIKGVLEAIYTPLMLQREKQRPRELKLLVEGHATVLTGLTSRPLSAILHRYSQFVNFENCHLAMSLLFQFCHSSPPLNSLSTTLLLQICHNPRILICVITTPVSKCRNYSGISLPH